MKLSKGEMSSLKESLVAIDCAQFLPAGSVSRRNKKQVYEQQMAGIFSRLTTRLWRLWRDTKTPEAHTANFSAKYFSAITVPNVTAIANEIHRITELRKHAMSVVNYIEKREEALGSLTILLNDYCNAHNQGHSYYISFPHNNGSSSSNSNMNNTNTETPSGDPKNKLILLLSDLRAYTVAVLLHMEKWRVALHGEVKAFTWNSMGYVEKIGMDTNFLRSKNIVPELLEGIVTPPMLTNPFFYDFNNMDQNRLPVGHPEIFSFGTSPGGGGGSSSTTTNCTQQEPLSINADSSLNSTSTIFPSQQQQGPANPANLLAAKKATRRKKEILNRKGLPQDDMRQQRLALHKAVLHAYALYRKEMDINEAVKTGLQITTTSASSDIRTIMNSSAKKRVSSAGIIGPSSSSSSTTTTTHQSNTRVGSAGSHRTNSRVSSAGSNRSHISGIPGGGAHSHNSLPAATSLYGQPQVRPIGDPLHNRPSSAPPSSQAKQKDGFIPGMVTVDGTPFPVSAAAVGRLQPIATTPEEGQLPNLEDLLTKQQWAAPGFPLSTPLGSPPTAGNGGGGGGGGEAMMFGTSMVHTPPAVPVVENLGALSGEDAVKNLNVITTPDWASFASHSIFKSKITSEQHSQSQINLKRVMNSELGPKSSSMSAIPSTGSVHPTSVPSGTEEGGATSGRSTRSNHSTAHSTTSTVSLLTEIQQTNTSSSFTAILGGAAQPTSHLSGSASSSLLVQQKQQPVEGALTTHIMEDEVQPSNATSSGVSGQGVVPLCGHIRPTNFVNTSSAALVVHETCLGGVNEATRFSAHELNNPLMVTSGNITNHRHSVPTPAQALGVPEPTGPPATVNNNNGKSLVGFGINGKVEGPLTLLDVLPEPPRQATTSQQLQPITVATTTSVPTTNVPVLHANMSTNKDWKNYADGVEALFAAALFPVCGQSPEQACTTIQKNWKMYKSRRYFLRAKKVAVTLQTTWRQWKQFQKSMDHNHEHDLLDQSSMPSQYEDSLSAPLLELTQHPEDVLPPRIAEATKIQCVFRGYLLRKNHGRIPGPSGLSMNGWLMGWSGIVPVPRWLRENKESLEKQCDCRPLACTVIQCMVRYHQARKQVALKRHMRERTFAVQNCRFMVHRQRLRFNKQVEAHRQARKERTEEVRANREKACVSVQAVGRGWLGRQLVSNIHAGRIVGRRVHGATTIQQWWRVLIIKWNFRIELTSHRTDRRHARAKAPFSFAALLIQKTWRGYQSRKRYNVKMKVHQLPTDLGTQHQLRCVRRIKWTWVAYKARKACSVYKKEKTNGLFIQKYQERRHWAVVRIQSQWRRVMAQRLLAYKKQRILVQQHTPHLGKLYRVTNQVQKDHQPDMDKQQQPPNSPAVSVTGKVISPATTTTSNYTFTSNNTKYQEDPQSIAAPPNTSYINILPPAADRISRSLVHNDNNANNTTTTTTNEHLVPLRVINFSDAKKDLLAEAKEAATKAHEACASGGEESEVKDSSDAVCDAVHNPLHPSSPSAADTTLHINNSGNDAKKKKYRKRRVTGTNSSPSMKDDDLTINDEDEGLEEPQQPVHKARAVSPMLVTYEMSAGFAMDSSWEKPLKHIDIEEHIPSTMEFEKLTPQPITATLEDVVSVDPNNEQQEQQPTETQENKEKEQQQEAQPQQHQEHQPQQEDEKDQEQQKEEEDSIALVSLSSIVQNDTQQQMSPSPQQQDEQEQDVNKTEDTFPILPIHDTSIPTHPVGTTPPTPQTYSLPSPSTPPSFIRHDDALPVAVSVDDLPPPSFASTQTEKQPQPPTATTDTTPTTTPHVPLLPIAPGGGGRPTPPTTTTITAPKIAHAPTAPIAPTAPTAPAVPQPPGSTIPMPAPCSSRSTASSCLTDEFNLCTPRDKNEHLHNSTILLADDRKSFSVTGCGATLSTLSFATFGTILEDDPGEALINSMLLLSQSMLTKMVQQIDPTAVKQHRWPMVLFLTQRASEFGLRSMFMRLQQTPYKPQEDDELNEGDDTECLTLLEAIITTLKLQTSQDLTEAFHEKIYDTLYTLPLHLQNQLQQALDLFEPDPNRLLFSVFNYGITQVLQLQGEAVLLDLADEMGVDDAEEMPFLTLVHSLVEFLLPEGGL